jgi:uncharacterized membrane protein
MSTNEKDPEQSPFERMPGHVAQGIEAIAAMHSAGEERVGYLQRGIERLTFLIGRPRTLPYILAFVIIWVSYNAAAPYIGAPQLDAPPFQWLQGVVGLAALLVTTFVLTTQNRQARIGTQRNHLDLQVNLVAEQKVAKLISLLEELRRDLPNVPNRIDDTADAMTHAVDPHAVASALAETIDLDDDPTKGDP